MPMLAELIDAVVGADTHRDTHEIEIAHPTGAPIAQCSIPNTSSGFTELVGWIAKHTPPVPGWWSRSRAPAATAPR